MIHLLLLAQLTTAAPDTVREGADVYATPAVRETVARAAALNRRVPAALRAYRAGVESEVAVVLRLPGGFERTVQLEQIASEVRWRRPGDFEQRVVGYRAQSSGVAFSSLSWFRSAWAIPHLYGNRLVLFFGEDTTGARRRRDSRSRDSSSTRDRGRRTLAAVHPLADDRDAVYRFSGGDTVVTVRVDGREIPIVRVKVEPRVVPRARTLLFRGELDLDATRHELVRMRGQFVAAGGKRSVRQRVTSRAVQAVLYVELVSREVEGRYWLPAFQRIEAQGGFIFGGETRSAARVFTRFHRIVPNDTVLPGDALRADASADSAAATDSMAAAAPAARQPHGDSLLARPHRLVVARTDSLDDFAGWRAPLGETTSRARSDDFDDIAPDAWRPTGRPRLDLRPERSGEMLRANRVEGLYTGLAARLRFRDAAPGLTLRGHAGWAWSEETARGAGAVEYERGRTRLELRAGRALRSTSDFLQPWDDGLGLEGLFGSGDLSDYVDRRVATVAMTRASRSGATLRVEAGPGEERHVFRSRERGLFGGDRLPRVRHAEAGRFVRSAVVADLSPAAGLIRPGEGARVTYERGDGELRWQRIEARLTSRRNAGPFTLDARADAGLVLLRDTLPQQLFELGGREGLTGYDEKEFGGDRAAIARGTVLYTTPWLRAPLQVGPARWRLWLPGIAPGIAASLHSGWSDTSGGVARAALDRLGMTTDPATGRPIADPEGELRAPVATDGIRTTLELTLRAFGGSIAVGAARPVDRGGAWRFVFRMGDEL